jgi:hypothetical protein
MTEANKKCSQKNKSGKECKMPTKYIRGGVNYCSRHFADNGEPYISANDQCSYARKIKNGNIQRCKKNILMLSGNKKKMQITF